MEDWFGPGKIDFQDESIPERKRWDLILYKLGVFEDILHLVRHTVSFLDEHLVREHSLRVEVAKRRAHPGNLPPNSFKLRQRFYSHYLSIKVIFARIQISPVFYGYLEVEIFRIHLLLSSGSNQSLQYAIAEVSGPCLIYCMD